MKYPLAVSTWDEKEIKAIHDVINSNNFSMGNKVKEFEEEFAKFVGAKYAVMVNSGSSANLLMVACLRYSKSYNLLPGDEVIVPAVSWPTTYYPLYQYGLKLRFVDIDLQTLNFDLNALKESITHQTKAILAVNLLGNPNEFTQIKELCEEKNLILLEDNCESLGAEYNGQQTGTFGLLGSYSSFFSHHIATMEGGLVVTNNEELYHILLSLRAHGWTRNLPMHNHVCGKKSENTFDEAYRFVLPGYNLRPIEMSGAIGIEQLKKLNHFIEMRKRNASVFLKYFSDNPSFYIQKEIGNSSWFAFSLVLKNNEKYFRNEIIEALMKEDIECRPIVAGNFAKNEVLKWMPHSIYGSLRNSEIIDSNGFYIGNHHYDLSENIEKLYHTLKQFF
ncbi:DegT/DnrJ/EryC1/StrS family aminotransferase [Pigmentibacter ruber]